LKRNRVIFAFLLFAERRIRYDYRRRRTIGGQATGATRMDDRELGERIAGVIEAKRIGADQTAAERAVRLVERLAAERQEAAQQLQDGPGAIDNPWRRKFYDLLGKTKGWPPEEVEQRLA
jgi:uncharacterized protein (DUF342 family)